MVFYGSDIYYNRTNYHYRILLQTFTDKGEVAI